MRLITISTFMNVFFYGKRYCFFTTLEKAADLLDSNVEAVTFLRGQLYIILGRVCEIEKELYGKFNFNRLYDFGSLDSYIRDVRKQMEALGKVEEISDMLEDLETKMYEFEKYVNRQRWILED